MLRKQDRTPRCKHTGVNRQYAVNNAYIYEEYIEIGTRGTQYTGDIFRK